jgi:hypothetical protein
MSLFKSRSEKRIEREIAIRKGLARIRRQIETLARSGRGYAEKARRARDLGAADQFEFLKAALRRTLSQQRLLERQLLCLETAAQIRDQAEAAASFAEAMSAVSRGIADSLRSVDLTKTQARFEESMQQARSMEERIALFMDLSAGAMLPEDGGGAESVPEGEVEAALEGAEEAEDRGADRAIAEGLAAIREELGKDREKK